MLTIYHDLLLINFKRLLFVAWGIKICIFYLPGKLLSWKDTWDCVRIGTIVWTHSLWKVITISRRTSEIQNIYQINILYSWWFNKPSKSQITIRSQKYWKNLLFVMWLCMIDWHIESIPHIKQLQTQSVSYTYGGAVMVMIVW